jgi:hypothetical protein
LALTPRTTRALGLKLGAATTSTKIEAIFRAVSSSHSWLSATMPPKADVVSHS